MPRIKIYLFPPSVVTISLTVTRGELSETVVSMGRSLINRKRPMPSRPSGMPMIREMVVQPPALDPVSPANFTIIVGSAMLIMADMTMTSTPLMLMSFVRSISFFSARPR